MDKLILKWGVFLWFALYSNYLNLQEIFITLQLMIKRNFEVKH